GSLSAPGVVYRENDYPSEFRMSERYLVRWSNGVYVRSLGSDTETSVAGGGEISNVFVRDDAVFMTLTNGNPGTTMWRESTGTIPFVRFASGSGRGTSNLATDGHDWAWTEATSDGKGGWENYELFTAPYSLDPA